MQKKSHVKTTLRIGSNMQVKIKQILETTPRTSKAGKQYTLTTFMGEDEKLYKDVYGTFTVGQEVEGEWKTDDFGTKFEVAKKGFGGFGKSPEQQASIVRQHSQEMALRYSQLKGKTDITFKDLQIVIDWFEADTKGVKAKETTVSATSEPDFIPEPDEAPFPEIDIEEINL